MENQRPCDGHRRTDCRAPLCLWPVGRAAWIVFTARHLEQGVLEETYARSGARRERGRFCARSLWIVAGVRV